MFIENRKKKKRKNRNGYDNRLMIIESVCIRLIRFVYICVCVSVSLARSHVTALHPENSQQVTSKQDDI